MEGVVKPLSTDLRRRIIEAHENREGTQTQIAKRFKVSRKTVYNVLRRWQEEDSLEPRPHGGGRSPSVTPEQEEKLRSALEEQPDLTLEELRQRCGISSSLASVDRAMRRMGITRKKKSVRYAEQLEDEIDAERQEWLAAVEDVDPARFVFLDESNAKTDMARRYARAPRGERALGWVPDARYESLTMLSSLDFQGRCECVVYEGGTTVDVMRTYAQEWLAPTLGPGDIVAMDNLSAHHNTEVVEAIESTGAEVWFLPRYSPDFNPVEKLWSKLKASLRATAKRTKDGLVKAIGEALQKVSLTDAQNWFHHCLSV